jgi:hypothetical protein
VYETLEDGTKILVGGPKHPDVEKRYRYSAATISGLTYAYLLMAEGGVLDMLKYYLDGKPMAERIKVFCVPESTDELETHLASCPDKPYNLRDFIQVLQEDGAGGHGFDNRHGGKPTKEHELLKAYLKRQGIRLEKQPPHSPELNMLDLGFWHMLKSAVGDRVGELPQNTGSNKDAIEAAIWAQIKEVAPRAITADKMFAIAAQRVAHLDAIVAAEGRPIPQEVHTGIRKAWGLGREASGASE